MLQPLPSCAAVPILKGVHWQQLSKAPLWLITRCCAVRPADARSTRCHAELLTFVHLDILLPAVLLHCPWHGQLRLLLLLLMM
jgi:hypothetical protein